MINGVRNCPYLVISQSLCEFAGKQRWDHQILGVVGTTDFAEGLIETYFKINEYYGTGEDVLRWEVLVVDVEGQGHFLHWAVYDLKLMAGKPWKRTEFRPVERKT